MKAMILAAGIGSRLGLDIPKPMYKINGKPVLEHNILLLKKHGIKEICINLHFKPLVIKKYFQDGKKWKIKIKYSFEKKLLGTAGAVKKMSSYFGKSSFFVIYGDNYSAINLTEMYKFHLKKKSIATIALFNPKQVKNSKIAGGVVTLDKNQGINSFIEGKSKTNGYVNAGVYILEPEVLRYISKEKPLDFGSDIFPILLRNNKPLSGYITKSFVLAIDTKKALSVTKNIIKNKKKEKK